MATCHSDGDCEHDSSSSCSSDTETVNNFMCTIRMSTIGILNEPTHRHSSIQGFPTMTDLSCVSLLSHWHILLFQYADIQTVLLQCTHAIYQCVTCDFIGPKIITCTSKTLNGFKTKQT